MPTVLRWNGYRFYFYSHEGMEPAHIHIDKDNATAKFWLQPVSLANSIGFKDNELNILINKVTSHQQEFIHAWNRHFTS